MRVSLTVKRPQGVANSVRNLHTYVMVIYDLACDSGHRFEGWFRDLEACQEQAGRGDLVCPVCGSSHIERLLTGSAIRRSSEDRAGTVRPPPLPAVSADGQPPAPPPAPDAAPTVTVTPEKVREVLGELNARLRANSEDVGPRFADEARKIHEQKAPERLIRGTATEAEEAELERDEIPFMKLPDLQDD